MRRKLVAFLGAAFVAAVLSFPVLLTHNAGSGRSGATIIASRD